MARDYRREYQDRQARAREHGFTSYSQERRIKEALGETTEEFRQPGYNPKDVIRETFGGAGSDGMARRDLMVTLIDGGVKAADAYLIMQEIMGEST